MGKKQDLRNMLEKRYADDKSICLEPKDYKHRKIDVVVVDLLTRLYYLNGSAEQNYHGDGFVASSVARDGAVLMRQMAKHFDWCYAKGARVVVCSLDKSAHVPITKGVEQRRRLDDTEANIRDLDHPDEEIARRAYEELVSRAKIHPWMNEKMRKDAKAIAKKLSKYEDRCTQLEDTYGRLTILALDEMRECWQMLPEGTRRDLLMQMKDLNLRLHVRDEKMGELREVDAGADIESLSSMNIELDDYQMEAVLMTAVRNQALPEPWDLLIRSNASEHGARPKITRYMVRALMHGYYDAYTPQIGTRLYIDGHNMPRWRLAQPNTYTRLQKKTSSDDGDVDDDKRDSAVVERYTPGIQKPRVKRVFIETEYDDLVPLELTNPADTRDYAKPMKQASESSSDAQTLRVQQQITPMGGFGVMQRGCTPNAQQPRVRYAKEYSNAVGEADMAVFTWLEFLRHKSNDYVYPKTDATQGLDTYESFEIISVDSDLFYYTLLYLFQLREAGEPEPQIILTMGPGWQPHERIFHMNRMYEAIVRDILNGDEAKLVSMIYSLYACAGDYIVGYSHVSVKSFMHAYMDGIDDKIWSGELVQLQPVHTVLGEQNDVSPNIKMWPVLQGAQYRRLLMTAYFKSSERTLTGTLGHASVAEFRNLAQLRYRLNRHIVSPKYRNAYYKNKDSTQPLEEIPVCDADPDDAEYDKKLLEADHLLKLFSHNIKKKIPTDEEILHRGLLLQYFMCMSWQLGARHIVLPDPLVYGYQLIDPDKPCTRRNIEFAACEEYELLDYLADEAELEAANQEHHDLHPEPIVM